MLSHPRQRFHHMSQHGSCVAMCHFTLQHHDVLSQFQASCQLGILSNWDFVRGPNPFSSIVIAKGVTRTVRHTCPAQDSWQVNMFASLAPVGTVALVQSVNGSFVGRVHLPASLMLVAPN